jgi:hypothetical protein
MHVAKEKTNGIKAWHRNQCQPAILLVGILVSPTRYFRTL